MMPTYWQAHARVKKMWGPAQQYPCCGCRRAWAYDWAYDHTDPAELHGHNGCSRPGVMSAYSAYPEFYMPVFGLAFEPSG